MSEAIIVAIIGGGAGFITALSTIALKLYDIHKANKEKSLEERIKPVIVEAIKPTNDKLDAMQTDVTRIRLLDLMRYEPTDAENILAVGKIYFKNMKGNSEASKQFARWLKEQHIKTPEWFNDKGLYG